jgi:membrane protease YdiL (CAAX protease family)
MCGKGIWNNRSAGFQLAALLIFMAIGCIAGGMVGIGVMRTFGLDRDSLFSHPIAIRTNQVISSGLVFMLPALTWSWFCGKKSTWAYLGVGQWPKARMVGLALGGWILLSPLVRLLEDVNRRLQLPVFLSDWEVWMQQQEATANKLVSVLTAGGGAWELMANLFVIAGIAALTEELFFRGAMRKIIGQTTENVNVIAWATAIIFCVVHSQFYTFLPRLVLGVYLGYLCCRSGSLWLPIVIHLVNNAVAVIALSNERLQKFIVGGEGELLSGINFWVCAGTAVAGYMLFRPLIRKINELAAVCKSAVVALLCLPLLMSCGEHYPKDALFGKWQLVEAQKDDGSVQKVGTVWYNFQHALFMYQLFIPQTHKYETCYGLRIEEEDGSFLLTLGTNIKQLDETFRGKYTDWTSTKQRFYIEKHNKSELILVNQEGTRYRFRRFG